MIYLRIQLVNTKIVLIISKWSWPTVTFLYTYTFPCFCIFNVFNVQSSDTLHSLLRLEWKKQMGTILKSIQYKSKTSSEDTPWPLRVDNWHTSVDSRCHEWHVTKTIEIIICQNNGGQISDIQVVLKEPINRHQKCDHS